MKLNKFCLTTILVFLFCQTFLAQVLDPLVDKNRDHPEISADLMSSEILLTDYKTKIKLNDYKDKFVVLAFVAEWNIPSLQEMSVLNDLYSKKPAQLNIIAVSSENAEDDKIRFRSYVNATNLKFQTGWINDDLFKGFARISKFNAVPQSFLIKDGKLYGVFVGGGQHVNQQMVNLVEKLLKE